MKADDHARFAKEIGLFLSKHTVEKQEELLTAMARILERGSRAGVPFVAFDRPMGTVPIGTDLCGHKAYVEWVLAVCPDRARAQEPHPAPAPRAQGSGISGRAPARTVSTLTLSEWMRTQ